MNRDTRQLVRSQKETRSGGAAAHAGTRRGIAEGAKSALTFVMNPAISPIRYGGACRGRRLSFVTTDITNFYCSPPAHGGDTGRGRTERTRLSVIRATGVQGREKDLSTEQDRSQAPPWLSRAHGDQERTRRRGRAPRPWPQAPDGLTRARQRQQTTRPRQAWRVSNQQRFRPDALSDAAGAV